MTVKKHVTYIEWEYTFRIFLRKSKLLLIVKWFFEWCEIVLAIPIIITLLLIYPFALIIDKLSLGGEYLLKAHKNISLKREKIRKNNET